MLRPTWIDRAGRGEPVTVVVFGTSLSFHLAPHLRNALVARYGTAVKVINAGRPAKASRTALQELEDRVLRFAPDAVLLEWAVNDAYSYEEWDDTTLDKGISLEESRVNLERLVERIAAALPDCEIALQTTNPTYDAPGDARAGSRRPDLADFYQVVREVASAHGLRLFDNHAFWNDLRERDEPLFRRLVPDGAHPTPAALREWLVPALMKKWFD